MGLTAQERLLRRAAAGDDEAFGCLVRLHEESLVALIRRLVCDEHQREDLLQETLLCAWRGMGSVRDPAKFRAWLYQVARNRCRDHLKSAQRRFVATERQDLEDRITRFQVRRGGDGADGIADALARVPTAEGMVAEMFYLKGLSIAEIARQTRRPPGTVKRLLFGARRTLRKLLIQEGQAKGRAACPRREPCRWRASSRDAAHPS